MINDCPAASHGLLWVLKSPDAAELSESFYPQTHLYHFSSETLNSKSEYQELVVSKLHSFSVTHPAETSAGTFILTISHTGMFPCLHCGARKKGYLIIDHTNLKKLFFWTANLNPSTSGREEQSNGLYEEISQRN